MKGTKQQVLSRAGRGIQHPDGGAGGAITVVDIDHHQAGRAANEHGM